MRIGLIARADSRGLGIQCKNFYDQMRPAKTMVVDCPSAHPLPLRRDWYPAATWIHGLPTHDDFRVWLQDLDVVYTAETGYGQALWDEAQRQGVKTVVHLNYEFLDLHDRPTVWAAPSMWHYDDIPVQNKCFLPVPIETERFQGASAGSRPQSESAINFLHIVGRPAIHDRNGTIDLLQALQFVTSEITVTVRCQQGGYVGGLMNDHQIRIPRNVDLNIEPGDVENYWDNYRNQHVLVMPRRFGGLCLPVNEALGAGMPVIMPDISPNNTWLPTDWLTPAAPKGWFRAKQHIDYYHTDSHALATKIDQFTDAETYTKAVVQAQELAQTRSWDALKPLYETILGS